MFAGDVLEGQVAEARGCYDGRRAAKAVGLQVRRQVGEELQLVARAGGHGDFHRKGLGVAPNYEI